MLFSEKKPCVTPERPEGSFRCEGGSCPRSGLRGRPLPAHAAPTGGNPCSPHSRGNTFAAPAPLSLSGAAHPLGAARAARLPLHLDRASEGIRVAVREGRLPRKFTAKEGTLPSQLRCATSPYTGEASGAVSLAPLCKGRLRAPSLWLPCVRGAGAAAPEGFPSCARRPDRRQSVQPPLARQHLCRPRAALPFTPNAARRFCRTAFLFLSPKCR